jgi:hypothetical protein
MMVIVTKLHCRSILYYGKEGASHVASALGELGELSSSKSV